MDMIIFCGLAGVFLLLLARVFLGPTLWDRILAANACSAVTSMSILFYALVSGNTMYADIAVVFMLTGFVGTQFYSVFIASRGKV